MLYYGTRLSDNLSLREPEGYLLCLNVPVARTGTQDYLPEELGLPPASAPVPVFRPEEEVFSPECIASFEGMPVTNDHPRDGVTVENARSLSRGHAQNVRRGSGEESDLLLADLMITDPMLIDAILHQGKREISCGYTYTLSEENGHYTQRQIRGNHVAVVDAGRAGPRVSIRDGQPPAPVPPTHTERSQRTMKNSLSRILARMARDGDPELAAELIEAILEPEADPAAPIAVAVSEAPEPEAPAAAIPVAVPAETPVHAEEPAATPEDPTPDEDPLLMQILDRLDRLITLMEAAPAAAAPAADEDAPEAVAEAVEEALEALAETADPDADPATAREVAALVEEIVSGEPSAVLSPDEVPEDPDRVCAVSKDALRAVLIASRPDLRKMSKDDRSRFTMRLTTSLGRTPAKTPSVYAAMAARDRKHADDDAELGRRIMEKRNPHYMKQ